MLHAVVGSFKPVLEIAFLALLQATVFATNVAEIEQTIEPGGNINLTCGNRNIFPSSVLSWSKDGENISVDITSHNQSTLVLSNLAASGSGLYVCTANSSIVLRRVQLTVETRAVVPVQEEKPIPDEGWTKEDIVGLVIGFGLTTFLVVSIVLLLYRAEKRLKEAKYMNRWEVSVKGQENMAVDEEFSKKSAFYIRTRPEPNRPPPPYRKPMGYGIDKHGIKYEVDENANEDNSERILQWRFTAYL